MTTCWLCRLPAARSSAAGRAARQPARRRAARTCPPTLASCSRRSRRCPRRSRRATFLSVSGSFSLAACRVQHVLADQNQASLAPCSRTGRLFSRCSRCTWPYIGPLCRVSWVSSLYLRQRGGQGRCCCVPHHVGKLLGWISWSCRTLSYWCFLQVDAPCSQAVLQRQLGRRAAAAFAAKSLRQIFSCFWRSLFCCAPAACHCRNPQPAYIDILLLF